MPKFNRTPIHQPLREEPRAEIRSEERKTRKARSGTGILYVNPDIIPEGMSYEWKRFSTHGQEDIRHRIDIAENHWEPVPVERHPELMPSGSKGNIHDGGMVLCERPAYLTEEALEDYHRDAVMAPTLQQQKIAVTPDGHAPRDEVSETRPRITRSVE